MRYLKRKLSNWVLKKLLNSVTEEELLLNLNPDERNSLALQAQDYLHQDSLFNLLKTEMDRVATIKIYNKSQSIDDIIWAKIMLYTNDLWKKKIKRLASELSNDAQRIGRE